MRAVQPSVFLACLFSLGMFASLVLMPVCLGVFGFVNRT